MNDHLTDTPAPVKHAADRLSAARYDSWLLQTAMIGHGLPTTRLPMNALIGGDPNSAAHVAFMHAEGLRSTFASRPLSQDRMSERVLLERNGLPVATGRTFHWGSTQSANRWAQAHGYPVAVSADRGPYQRRSRTVIHDAQSLATAMDRNKGRTGRVMLETLSESIELQLLVLDGKVLSALQWEGNALKPTGPLHPELTHLATVAVTAIPGVECAVVEVNAENPGSPLADQRVTVSHVGTSPHLRPHEAVAASAGVATSSRPVAQLLAHEAAQQELELVEGTDLVALTMELSGLVDPQALLADLRSQCEQLTVRIDHTATHSDEDMLTLPLSGHRGAIALVAVNAINGLGRGQRAHLVTTSGVETSVGKRHLRQRV